VLTVLGGLGLSPLSTWHLRSADRDVVLDCTRAAELLRWTPALSGADALCGAYDWFTREGATAAVGTTHRSAWRERGLALIRRLS
jgi:hypothetical protein